PGAPGRGLRRARAGHHRGEPPGPHPRQPADGAVEQVRLARADDRQQVRDLGRRLEALRRSGGGGGRGRGRGAAATRLRCAVLATGNTSETSVGYSTLYGDAAGGFAVIKGVPKTLVYRLV